MIHKNHKAKYATLELYDHHVEKIKLPAMQYIFSYLLPDHKPPPVIGREGLRTQVLSVGTQKQDYDLFRVKEGFVIPETITFFYDGYPVVLEKEKDLCYLLSINLTNYFTPNEVPVDPALDHRFLELHGKYLTQEDIDYFRKPSVPEDFPTIVIEKHPGTRDKYGSFQTPVKIFCAFRDKPPVFVYGSCPNLHTLVFALSEEKVYTCTKGTVRTSITNEVFPPLPGVALSELDRGCHPGSRVTVQDYSVLPSGCNSVELPAHYFYSPTGVIVYSSVSKCCIRDGVLELPDANWKDAKQPLLDLMFAFGNYEDLDGFELGELIGTAVQKVYDVLGVEIVRSIPIIGSCLKCLGDALDYTATGECIEFLHTDLNLNIFVTLLPH